MLVAPDKNAGALRITASDLGQKRAQDVATAIALRLVVAANQQAIAAYNADYHFLDLTRVGLQQQADTLNNKLNLASRATPPTSARSTRSTKPRSRELEDVQERILRLEQSKPIGPSLAVLQPAIPIKVVASHGLAAPNDPLSRLLLAALIGLLLGIAAAALMNRQSETVYGVPSVEAATMLPGHRRDALHQRRSASVATTC